MSVVWLIYRPVGYVCGLAAVSVIMRLMSCFDYCSASFSLVGAGCKLGSGSLASVKKHLANYAQAQNKCRQKAYNLLRFARGITPYRILIAVALMLQRLIIYFNGLFMWFKNLRIYRLHPDWDYPTERLLHALEGQRFHPLGSQDEATVGWVESAEEYGLAMQVERQILLCVQTEKKLLPPSVVNQFARERALVIEAEQGFRPGRKQMQEIKEDAIAILLPRAFSVQRRTHLWVDPINRWLVIDAAAQSTADEILALLGETFAPFPALPVHTKLAPSAVMSQWLGQQDEPEPFLIEEDAELRAKNDSRAVVRYLRHSLDRELIQEQLAQGMYCSRLGLSWADRIAFVLYENLELRRVTPLDLLTDEQSSDEHDPAAELAASFLLMCTEYNALFKALLEKLGGEKDDQDG